jgi:flagellar assembly protein FliH
MSNHRGKFLFDKVFDSGKPAPQAPAKPKPRFTDDDLVNARREGQEAGFQMGLEQATRQQEAKVAATLSEAAQALVGLDHALQTGLESIKADATQVALAVAARLAPALIERQPLTELSEMVADCLRQMPTEPRVVIRVADPLVDALQPHVNELGRATGFAGQLVLIGEPEMAAGDARVEWADGGAERNLAALHADIAAAVDRYCRGQHELAARRAEPAPAPAATPSSAAVEPPPLADDENDAFDAGLPALAGGESAQ